MYLRKANHFQDSRASHSASQGPESAENLLQRQKETPYRQKQRDRQCSGQDYPVDPHCEGKKHDKGVADEAKLSLLQGGALYQDTGF
jgi:hypothetical protein